jgi:hypothetical protein
MKEAVIVVGTGITYEKKAIREWFQGETFERTRRGKRASFFIS